MAHSPDIILTINELCKNYGTIAVLKGISLQIKKGEVVGFIGASGSGKSTLLRCINMLEIPTAGETRLKGELIGFQCGTDRRKLLPSKMLSMQRRKMAMVFQQFNLWPHRTALENVTESLVIVQGMNRQEANERGRKLLRKVGLAERMDTYPGRLSGGEQQRVGIARALATEPILLLLDEPTSALDPELVGEVLQVIRSLADDGQTMIIVTHEMSFARDICDRIFFLADGLIADVGPPEYIFGSTAQPRTKAFVARYVGAPANAGAPRRIPVSRLDQLESGRLDS